MLVPKALEDSHPQWLNPQPSSASSRTTASIPPEGEASSHAVPPDILASCATMASPRPGAADAGALPSPEPIESSRPVCRAHPGAVVGHMNLDDVNPTRTARNNTCPAAGVASIAFGEEIVEDLLEMARGKQKRSDPDLAVRPRSVSHARLT